MAKTDKANSAAQASSSKGVLRMYENFGLRAKIVSIVVAFALVTSIVAAVAISATMQASDATHKAEKMQKDVSYNIGVVHQEEIKARMLIALYAAMPTGTNAAQQEWVDKIAATDADIATAVGNYEAGIADLGSAASTLGGADWQTFKDSWAQWTELRDAKMVPAAADTDQVAFLAGFNEASDALSAAIDALEREEELVTQATRKLANDSASAATTSITLALVVLVVGLVSVVALALGAASILRRQVAHVRVVAEALADGDFTKSSGVDSRDEIGQMGLALDKATDNLRATMAKVAGSAKDVATAAETLANGNAEVAAGAAEVSARAEVVSTAATEVSRNLTGVSSGSEEMTASIREIAHSTNEAARVAQQAANAAQAANEQIGRLGNSSQEIGNVVKVITTIAEQTNLLALNATIEAARAGEAGKGFAVVAGEVGELARETARATEDISKRVEAIQTDAQGAVSVIAQIAEIVQRINEYQSTIASAIEEQTATTNEMGRNVSDAAAGSNEIASGIEGVALSAANSSQVLGEVSRSVDELNRLSVELHERVSSFTY